jgi:hypothetical protein
MASARVCAGEYSAGEGSDPIWAPDGGSLDSKRAFFEAPFFLIRRAEPIQHPTLFLGPGRRSVPVRAAIDLGPGRGAWRACDRFNDAPSHARSTRVLTVHPCTVLGCACARSWSCGCSCWSCRAAPALVPTVPCLACTVLPPALVPTVPGPALPRVTFSSSSCLALADAGGLTGPSRWSSRLGHTFRRDQRRDQRTPQQS